MYVPKLGFDLKWAWRKMFVFQLTKWAIMWSSHESHCAAPCDRRILILSNQGLSLNFTYESLNATLYHILQVPLAVWTSRDFVHNNVKETVQFSSALPPRKRCWGRNLNHKNNYKETPNSKTKNICITKLIAFVSLSWYNYSPLCNALDSKVLSLSAWHVVIG